MKSIQTISLFLLALIVVNCKKDQTPSSQHECTTFELFAHASWEQDTVPYPPGTAWNTTNDTLYTVSIQDDYSSWYAMYPFEHCSCDNVVVDFSSSDSLVHIVLIKDGIIIDSTLNYGTRKFVIFESGTYDFKSVYLDTTSIWPFNSNTVVSAGWSFTFEDCDILE